MAFHTRSAALLGLVVLLAGGALSQGNLKDLKDLCRLNRLVVTEIYDEKGIVFPKGVDPADTTSFVGSSLGFNDPIVFGGSGNSSRKAGVVKSVCYFMGVDGDKLDNYCHTTLIFGSFGQVSFVGPFPDYTGSDFYNAIAGGTGLFDGVSGGVHVTVLKGGERWKYALKFSDKGNCLDP